MLLLGAAEKRGAISLPPRLHGRCENPRGRTLFCRFGRVAGPRSSVALSTLALFKLILDESSYDCSGSPRWSGGKPPFLTCELARLEPSFWINRLRYFQRRLLGSARKLTV